MDQSLKKVKVKWDNAAEKQLIDIWADLLTEHSGKMITRKSREKIATTRLNQYLQEELGITEQYSESAVHNKVDNFLKKGKQMYLTYQKKGETGKGYTKDDVAIDEEAAKLAWPNFSTFFARFKDHPSLGPGSVEDAAITPVIREEIVPSDSGSTEIPNTPSTSRCPSRSSNRTSVDGSDDDDDEVIALGEDEDDDEDSIPTKKKFKASTPIPRVNKKRNPTSNAGQFLVAFGEMQAAAQQRQIEHEQKM